MSYSIQGAALVLIPQAACNVGSFADNLDENDNLTGPNKKMAILGLNLFLTPISFFGHMIYNQVFFDLILWLDCLMFTIYFVYLCNFGILFGMLNETIISKCKQVAKSIKMEATYQGAMTAYDKYLELKTSYELGLFVVYSESTINLTH